MTNCRKLSFPSTLTILAVGYLMISPANGVASGSIGDSVEISALLSDAKSEALELRDDADHMQSFTRSNLSWQSYAGTINEIKNHINKAGGLLAKLTGVRETGSSWQQQAIDQITPVLKELAANTEATIEYLKENRTFLHSTQLQDYCRVNYELARDLTSLVTDFIDYGETKAKFEELQEKVEAR